MTAVHEFSGLEYCMKNRYALKHRLGVPPSNQASFLHYEDLVSSGHSGWFPCSPLSLLDYVLCPYSTKRAPAPNIYLRCLSYQL